MENVASIFRAEIKLVFSKEVIDLAIISNIKSTLPEEDFALIFRLNLQVVIAKSCCLHLLIMAF